MAKRQTPRNANLRLIPSVDQLLQTEGAVQLRESHGIRRVTAVARHVISEIRSTLRAKDPNNAQTEASLLAEAVERMQKTLEAERLEGIKRVINATGVVLHTNLGRAPLSQAAIEAIAENGSRYCTVEYDAISGTRGRRGGRVEALLQELTGAEDALVVNNCAAAALLVLAVLAKDGETIVSRGELVEIGGDFRVPDVMSNSGTRMVEVGTTNRTHLEDYNRAINEATRLIMRVHPSNYRIVGFSASPTVGELANLAHKRNIPFYEDAGSGQLNDLSAFGITDEPPVRHLINQGADLVSFSGDKLLGSAQAGIIVGRREIVQKLRRHPLYRALRIDKLRIAALESTLADHQRDGRESVPVLKMLSISVEELEKRARFLVEKISPSAGGLELDLLSGTSASGGGSSPNSELPTTLISISHGDLSAQQIETKLRASSPPIISRISNDRVLLDLRTVFPDEEPFLLKALTDLNS